MVTLSLLDPTSFQEQALAWIGVATVVLGAFSGLVAATLAYYNRIKIATAKKDGEDDHAVNVDAIKVLQEQVSQLSLTTPTSNNQS